MEKVPQMYGSVHTHFEDMYDTANDLKKMVKEFAFLGSKKVALTGHGSMFAYEDLKEIVANLKETKEIDEDFEIIPGCEVYVTMDNLNENSNENLNRKEEFSEENQNSDVFEKTGSRHMVLVAKNYEGYKDLCKVISTASKNTKATKTKNEDNEYLTPLVTLENLKENIRKGNIFMTTACIGGIFGFDLGLVEHNLKEDVKKEERKFNQESYQKSLDIIKEYQEQKENPQNKKPTKAERTKAAKLLDKGDDSLFNELEEREQHYTNYLSWKELHKSEYEKAKKDIKKYESRLEKIEEVKSILTSYQETEADRWQYVKDEYEVLKDIFGEENIFFELQNHGLEMEKPIFNNMIRLAYEVGNPNFIASNDIHIGDRKGSDTWQSSVMKRRVEKYFRFKNIEISEDEEEYGIKTDEELKESLMEIIDDYSLADGTVIKKEEIIDKAIKNIENSLQQCEIQFQKIDVNGYNHYPKYSDNEPELFEAEVRKGFQERFPNGAPSKEYEKRLEYEINIIKSMGYSGYHLIVKDYLEYARLLGCLRTQEEIDNAPLSIEALNQYIDEKKIPRIGMGVGPGRGSAAGSLACYCLKIVDVDPLQYGLLFERFLNPERVSMPDIDSDFKDDIRERLYEYIQAKYGEAYVSKVCTKAYCHGKKAVDKARMYLTTEKQMQLEKEEKANFNGEDKKEFDKNLKNLKEQISKKYIDIGKGISKKIDIVIKQHGLNATKVEDATKAVRIMLENGDCSEEEREIMQFAVDNVAGIPSELSMHACAAIISGDPLAEVIPLAWNDKNQKLTTQCLYPQAENLGLLKMDLLNIKNLSVITKVMQEVRDIKLMNPETIQEILKDERIYKEIYSQGLTKGIFQVESDGMTKMMKDFKPSCFEDIVLLVAAYRPGPLDFIPEIIASKKYEEDPIHNSKPKRSINIDNEILQSILAPTYGVPIYQEQVMQIFQHLAGYSLAGADHVRRFMSKKKMEPLKKEKPAFIYGDPERNIPGCMAAGLTEKEADDLFEKLVEFSKYAFNKSHALCYALVSVITAYQKLYYTVPFYKYTLSNEMKDSGQKKIPTTEKYIEELRHFGIDLLPPSIQKSQEDITVERTKDKVSLRMGFGNIKGHSYEDYNPSNSLYSFILKNPDVSLAKVSDFIKLGMFNACWFNREDQQREIDRVNNNREEMNKWLEIYGEKIKTLALLYQEIISLKKQLEDLDKQIKENNVSEEIFQKFDLLENQYNLKNNSKLDIINDLKGALYNDNNNKFPKESLEKQIEYRSFEVEKLGMFLNTRESLKLIAEKGNKKTLSDLQKAMDSLVKEKNGTFYLPATLVSSKEKISQKGNKYYIYQLMDQKGQILNVRTFHTPTILDGTFVITYSKDEKGYENYICTKEIPFMEKEIHIKPFDPTQKNIQSGITKTADGVTNVYTIESDYERE